MASKREEVNLHLTAKDDATAVVSALDKRLDGLTDDDKIAVLRADSTAAQREIEQLTRKLADAKKYDDDTIAMFVEARGDAQRRLDAIQAELRDLEGETAVIDVDANTASASTKLDALKDKFGDFDGPIGDIGAKLGKLASPQGAIAALGAGLVLAGQHAADIAIEADNLSKLTGDNVETASRLNAVWKSTGADAKDLQDVLLQMQGVLADDADLAAQLGVNLKDGRGIGERFQQVVRAVGEQFDDAGERAVIMSRLFGEEGVRQVNSLTATVGDLDTALAELPDASIVSDTEVESAREYQANIRDLKLEFAGLAQELGDNVVPLLTQFSSLVGLVVDAGKKGGGIWKAIKGQDGGELEEFLQGVTDAKHGIEDLGGASELTGDQIAALAGQEQDYIDSLLERKKATGAVSVATGAASAEQVRYEESLLDAAAAGRMAKKSAEDKARADEEAARAAEEHRNRVEDLTSSLRQLVGGDIAVREAQRRASEAVAEYTAAANDANTTTEELAALQDDAAAELLRSAEAAASYEIATRKAAGEALSQADITRIQKERLAALAQTLDPGSPLRKQIDGYVNDLTDIPQEVWTAIGADPDEDSIARAEEMLRQLARDRIAVVQARIAGATVTNDGGWDFGGGRIARKSGGPVPGPRDAPVPAILHGGEHVLSADVVDAIKRGGPTAGLGRGGTGRTACGATTAVFSDEQVRTLADTLAQAVLTASNSQVNGALNGLASRFAAGARG